ncbi:MAG: C69 family dipeptidase [Bacteroidales bacterium]|nr:C69 family dipeptidase [Bacteroidales bacterium]MDY2917779.1 C69 family dipeptidase [Muribaculaceae bacterium]
MGLGTPGSEACTSLIATPGATANGSSMITYAADSHVLYGELYNQPAADHAAGTMRPVVDWDTRTPLGEIPEAAHTYATIGNMNEHGLTIAESTWGGREELKGSGTIDYGSLIYITLQRARTAREAITVMTDLVDKYGYASEGESFSIADPNEVWIMELIGKGKADKGAVWVARRVPDGYISGHANHSRIHRFPLNDPETLYSKDVIDFARQQGYFTGKDEDFDFSRAYAIYDMGALRGCDGRVWAYFNKFAPKGTMDEYLPWVLRGEGPELPLWVKPEAKLSATDLKWIMRDHFEDTPMDMTKDIGAGPFAVPYRWRPLTYKVDGQEYTHERAIATQQTGFSFVAEMNKNRHQAMKGILWFGTDDANTCVYLPVFNSTAVAPYQLQHGNGDILTLSWDANFWVNNYVANQAYNRYSQMIPDIRRVQKGLEDGIADAVAAAEKDIAGKSYTEAQSALATITNHWAAKATKDYKALGDFLLVKYLDGNIKKQNTDGTFMRTETGDCASPVFGGYDERYYRSITNEQGDRLKVIELK